MPSGITANVLWEDPQDGLLTSAHGWLGRGVVERDGDGFRFSEAGLPVWDQSDPDSGPLYLHFIAADGQAAIIVAPDLEADEAGVNELERRITRDLGGSDFTVDDWGPSASSSADPFALSADEARALLEVLADSELYVQEDGGGWVSPQTEAALLAPLRERLLSAVPAAPAEPPRTFLLHMNVEMPADTDASVADLEAEVLGALEVGKDSDMTPYLSAAVEICIPLAEEV